MWYIYTMEYYAAEKNNDILKFAGKWMELENVILSEDDDPKYEASSQCWAQTVLPVNHCNGFVLQQPALPRTDTRFRLSSLDTSDITQQVMLLSEQVIAGTAQCGTRKDSDRAEKEFVQERICWKHFFFL
ncbi:hypothetical protein STEG23_028108 [Scotinomys teguina]